MQRDWASDAAGEVALALNPLTMNRSAYAASNPIGSREAGGHQVIPQGPYGPGKFLPEPLSPDNCRLWGVCAGGARTVIGWTPATATTPAKPARRKRREVLATGPGRRPPPSR